jgi:hypothetical protein
MVFLVLVMHLEEFPLSLCHILFNKCTYDILSYSLIYFNIFLKGGAGMAREFIPFFLTSRMCEVFLSVSILYSIKKNKNVIATLPSFPDY